MQTVQPGPHLSVGMKSSGNVPLNESKETWTPAVLPVRVRVVTKCHNYRVSVCSYSCAGRSHRRNNRNHFRFTFYFKPCTSLFHSTRPDITVMVDWA